MARDVLLIKTHKQKPLRATPKKAPPGALASQRQSIGRSHNFVNDEPRTVRHRNAADRPRQLHARWALYATGTFLAQLVFGVQAEIDLRTSLYKHKGSPFTFEPNNRAGTAAAQSRMPSRPASRGTLRRSGLMESVVARRQGYGKGQGRNMTFADDRLGSLRSSGMAPDTHGGDNEAGSFMAPPHERAAAPITESDARLGLPTRSPMPQLRLNASALAQPTHWYDDATNALSWVSSFFFDESADTDYVPSSWPFPGGFAAPAHRRHKVTRRPANSHHSHHQPHHEPHQHHHKSHHSAATHPPVLHQILGNIITRRELGEFLMRLNGLDPHALYNHTSRPVLSEAYKETKPGIDLYIDSQKTEWFVRNTYSPEIESLPDLDDIFWDMIDSVQLQAKNNITRELTEAAQQTYRFPQRGGGGTYTLKSIKLTELVDREFGKTDTSSIGYILDVDDQQLSRRESYVIAAAHNPPLIRIPTGEDEQIEWLGRHEKLFFNSKSKVPKKWRTISTEMVERYATIHLLIDDAADYISKNIVNAFKNDAFGETRRERMVNHLQWHVPFYAAWLAYKRHEHTEAVVRTILDVIALAGGPFAKALKAAGIAMRNGRLINLAKQAQKIGYLDVPGQLDSFKKKVLTGAGQRIGGPAGRALADFVGDEINQSPQENTLNQIVDGANSGRGRDKDQIDSVVRNT